MRFSFPVRSSSTEANCPVRLTLPRTASDSRTMSCPNTRATRVRTKQGREHAYGRRLARAVRTEEAVDLPANHLEVHARDRHIVPETVNEPFRAYRQRPVPRPPPDAPVSIYVHLFLSSRLPCYTLFTYLVT